MSSETTELTFVRCPSCRSLVPATATRCRICNNPLDGGPKADDGDAHKNAGRIRQKTMTASAEDIASALGSSGASTPVPPTSAQTAQSSADVDSDVDPLGAYLQELEEAEEMGLGDASRSFKPASPKPSDDHAADDFDPFDLDIFDELDDELSSAAPQQSVAEARPATKQAEPATGVERAAGQAAPSLKASEPARRPTGNPISAPRAGGLNGQSRADDRRVQEVQTPRPTKREEPQRSANGADRSAEKSRAEAGARPSKAQSGRLLGWLVSYENADGRAIELREGRFFITSNSIKDTDLVIEDPSISTPHALMSVAVQGGIKVQDLMSESGTHIRSANDDDYRREESSVELKHGDWIRLGEVEFLVATVPLGRVRD